MIARTWRGWTDAKDSDAYLEYLHRTGLAAFRATPGNAGAYVLRRLVDGRAEFFMVSLWESEDAVRAFAGPDIAKAVFFPEDDQYLVEREMVVDHFDVPYQRVGANPT